MVIEFTQWPTWRKGLEIYSANVGLNVGGLAYSSFLVVITCGDIYNECNYTRPRSALCGRCAGCDKTTIEGMYVAIKIKKIVLYLGINGVTSTYECLMVMWPADARAFSGPTSKAREKRPGDEVEQSKQGTTNHRCLYAGYGLAVESNCKEVHHYPCQEGQASKRCSNLKL